MAVKKRKLSPYNKFVKKQMAKETGTPQERIKKVAAKWRKMSEADKKKAGSLATSKRKAPAKRKAKKVSRKPKVGDKKVRNGKTYIYGPYKGRDGMKTGWHVMKSASKKKAPAKRKTKKVTKSASKKKAPAKRKTKKVSRKPKIGDKKVRNGKTYIYSRYKGLRGDMKTGWHVMKSASKKKASAKRKS